jgi:two-component sensor histidine kinase
VSLEDAQLVVTELVTNAVLHAATEVQLTLDIRPGTVRVEVADGNERLPRPREADAEDVTGRGLLLVAAVAESWGVSQRDDDGKVVWCALGHRRGT